MTGDDSELEEVRVRLVQILQDDEYRIEEVAYREGLSFIKQLVDHPSEYGLIRHILQLLEKTTDPLRRVEMKNRPGPDNIAYRIVDPVHRNLYIKVKIEDGKVTVISFHRSIYY